MSCSRLGPSWCFFLWIFQLIKSLIMIISLIIWHNLSGGELIPPLSSLERALSSLLLQTLSATTSDSFLLHFLCFFFSVLLSWQPKQPCWHFILILRIQCNRFSGVHTPVVRKNAISLSNHSFNAFRLLLSSYDTFWSSLLEFILILQNSVQTIFRKECSHWDLILPFRRYQTQLSVVSKWKTLCQFNFVKLPQAKTKGFWVQLVSQQMHWNVPSLWL